MEPNPSLMLFMSFLCLGLASSSYISYDGLMPSGLMGRNLLQAVASCPINFEDQNYTIITSQCKGPNYPQKPCCESFKQFACPFADEVNDGKNDCATTMFSYINLYGKYPPGLFSNMCKEGTEGLECTDVEIGKSQKSGGIRTAPQSPLLAFSAGFLMLLLYSFY